MNQCLLKKRKNKALVKKKIKMTPQENTPEVLSMKQKVAKIVI